LSFSSVVSSMNRIEPRANLAFRDRETKAPGETPDTGFVLIREDNITVEKYPLKWMLLGLGLFCGAAWYVLATVFSLIF
jgi:hypothetical protein